jgi:nucleoid-associated protein YgaU
VFDVVRVEPDGAALVAGQAAPGASVGLFVEGAEAARVAADGQGRFVALFTLEPSAAPRLLTLAMRLADGTEVAGRDSVALAAIAPPAPEPAVATAAEPAVQPEPEGVVEAVPEAQAEPELQPAPEPAPTALLVTEAGVEVLQDAAPDAAVSIDTITYAPDGAVRTAGRGAAGAAVRLYLDNAPLADVAVAADGQWQVTLPEVEPGLYTLRADQLDAAGAVTARFETPFLRETPQELVTAAETPAPPAPEPAPAAAVPPPPPAAAPVADAPPPPPAMVTITVQPGFTLWQIARDNFGAGTLYVQLFEANRELIRDPDLIYPGQVFTVPALRN